ncbi:putative membrane protein [Propionispora sp. 2/2-37]|uniref:GerAB/ArcD/ProY family transporter n=1 Tax=Propionispora sp. 2/2-37 TaxID=1677858 RepID=UPI0006BB68C3|nr:endospore germination permease [Propionispora sp. 2/2-37]CUH96507.1 putative membrane protein [Propionispora sp. 2/2-37]
MERISSYQLFAITVLFQIGTTIIFGFSASAGRDAWISVLLSTALGIMGISLYLALMKLHPGLTLVEWYPRQFGRWLGTPIAWLYPLLLIYDAGRGLGDLRDLIPTTILPATPHVVILGIFMMLIAYVLFCGIETLGRLGEVWLPILFITVIIEIVLIIGSEIVQIESLQPIAGQGWEKIWSTVWPLGVTQTFGETIGLAMIWPLVKESGKIVKTTLAATILVGFFIALLDAVAISVLGEATFTRSIYPLYVLIQQINVADFIQNLDALGVMYFLTTTFFKLSIHLFGAIYGMQKLTRVKNSRIFILPVTLIVLYLGLKMASSVLDHIDTGLKVLPYNLWVPLFYVLPTILFVVAWCRQKLTKGKREMR